MSDELRQDIAGAIYDATGLRGEAWATASDVADEYVLADAVMAVVQPLVDERDRLKNEAVHYIAQRLALDEVAKHADALRVERDRLLWLHAEAVWQRDQLQVERDDLDQELDAERIAKPAMAMTQNADLRVENETMRRAAQGNAEVTLQREARLRNEAAELQQQRAALWDLCKKVARSAMVQRCKSCHDDGKELAALRASAVVLPKDWRQRLGECESSGAAVDLVESWLGTVEAAPPHGPDDHEWVPCKRCPNPDQPCACAGGVCCETERTEMAAGVSGTGTEASKAAAAPSPDVDREMLVEVLSRDHAEINALWDEDPDDYWRTLADRLIAAGYICTPGHEWQCPGCGATTRARMADYPTERDGAAQIVAERHRVVTAKGYDAAHDDHHVHGELLDAARCYFNQGLTYFAEHTNAFGIDAYSMYDQNWPWWSGDQPAGWKPSSSPVRNLVKAGQFIAAEIDRLKRAERGDLS